MRSATSSGLKAVAGVALEAVAGVALGIASMAVADTISPDPVVRRVVAIALMASVMLAACAVLVLRGRKQARRRNLSSNSQAHNLSIRTLSRRFRRG